MKKNSVRKLTPRSARPVVEALETRELLAGGWAPLANLAPSNTGTMMLLSDGTVMVQGAGTTNAWHKLTPDSSGAYVNGTWSTLAPMNTPRLYFGSNVLPSGKVFLVGGEYSGSSGAQNATNTGEIYNPVANIWSPIANYPQGNFGDDPTAVLPGGKILAGYLFGPQTYLYDPAADTWSTAGTKLRNDRSDEETWVKLPDGSILSYDIFSSLSASPGHAQRYIPATNTWVDAGTVPVSLSSTALGEELGPAFLLPDGRVFQIGANSNTAFYTPSTNTWAVGPTIPNGKGADDAPGAILPNGHVIFAADTPLFKAPTQLFDFDPVANTITPMTLPAALTNVLNNTAYWDRMLVLPSGDVLFTASTNQLWDYNPNATPNSSWKPTISSVAPKGGFTYTLAGTQLNGLSEGASYGDDAEMSSNYPIIELKDGSGKVFFARTFNWSSTGVATGSTPVTTDFTLPAGLPLGTYSLYVVANGIASDPLTFAFGPPDQPLQAVGVNGTATVNAPFSGVVATFTDSDPQPAPATSYAALISWGDGSTSTGTVTATGGGTFSVSGTHPYGPISSYTVSYTVSVTITDKDTAHDAGGAMASATSTIQVSDPLVGPDPTFSLAATSPSGPGPVSMVLGNLKAGDNTLYLFVANFDGNSVSVMRPTGNDAFQLVGTFPTGSGANSVAVGDFNSDGNTDIAVADYYDDSVGLLFGDGHGGFGPVKAIPTNTSRPDAIVAADFNGDGKTDLAVANYLSSDVAVLLSNGNGTFTTPGNPAYAGRLPVHLAAADLDGDKKPDLVITDWGDNTVTVLLTNSVGGLRTKGTYAAGDGPQDVVVADFDRDGHPDLVVTDYRSGKVAFLKGDGTGGFLAPTFFDAGRGAAPVVAGYFDGDGKLDLAVGDMTDNTVSVLRGDGFGRFLSPVAYPVGSRPEALALGNFDSDNKVDLAAANYLDNTISVLKNTTGNGPLFALRSGAKPGPARDVTSQLQVSTTAPAYDAASRLYASTITVASLSVPRVAGPFQLVLTDLPASVSVAGAQVTVGGVTRTLTVSQTPAGTTLLNIPADLVPALAKGQSFSVRLLFNNPLRLPFLYRTSVFSDSY